MVAWGPILGAGISALGSLFGGSDDDETTTTIDYKEMADEAMKAGFNPLTAIRNGGSAGFTTVSHPALSGAAFGGAFQTLGNALMSWDARADERAAVELDIQRAQLAALNKSNAASFAPASDPQLEVPAAHAATRVVASTPPLAPDGTRARPYPRYIYSYDPDDPTNIVKSPNIEVMPDDPSGLAVGGLAEGAQKIEDALNWLRPKANGKPQGNPGGESDPLAERFGYPPLGGYPEEWRKPGADFFGADLW